MAAGPAGRAIRADQGDDRPLFLPGRYKAGKIGLTPSAYQEIVRVLRMLPVERRDRDLRAFQPLHSIPHIRNLKDKERQVLFQVARLRECYKGEYLFAQGSKASVGYIILKGRVNLLHSKAKDKAKQALGATSGADERHAQSTALATDSQPTLLGLRNAFDNARTTPGAAAERAPPPTTQPEHSHPAKTVSVVGEADELRVLGEAALSQLGDEVNKVAARAVTECVTLMVRRTDYLAALQEHMAETLSENIKFLKRVSLFRTWPDERLKKLAVKMVDRSYPPESVIIRQDDVPGDFFVVRVGHVKQLRETRGLAPADEPAGSLELERIGPHGFFGEACQAMGLSKQPNTVESVTNVVLAALPAAEFRDVLRNYPTVRNTIKSFAGRRYPSQEEVAATAHNRKAWETYKRDVTKRISRQAQSLSAQRFGRAPPLPHEPRESVVAVATAEDDVVGVAKSPQRSKYTSHGHFLASPKKRRPLATTDLEPGLLAIRARYKKWQAAEKVRRQHRARTPLDTTRSFQDDGQNASWFGVTSRVPGSPASSRVRIAALLNDLVNRGPSVLSPSSAMTGFQHDSFLRSPTHLGGTSGSSPSSYVNLNASARGRGAKAPPVDTSSTGSMRRDTSRTANSRRTGSRVAALRRKGNPFGSFGTVIDESTHHRTTDSFDTGVVPYDELATDRTGSTQFSFGSFDPGAENAV